MPKLIINEQEMTGTGATTAKQLKYDNTTSNLSATTTQSAIDEVNTNLISHLADTVSHITSDERIKWDGYEESISTNSTAITQLNSDFKLFPIALSKDVNEFSVDLSNYSEILVFVQLKISSVNRLWSTNIPTSILCNEYGYFIMGAYASSSDNTQVSVRINNNSIKLNEVFVGGTNYMDKNPYISVFGRK
jgi:hypothetical protein